MYGLLNFNLLLILFIITVEVVSEVNINVQSKDVHSLRKDESFQSSLDAPKHITLTDEKLINKTQDAIQNHKMGVGTTSNRSLDSSVKLSNPVNVSKSSVSTSLQEPDISSIIEGGGNPGSYPTNSASEPGHNSDSTNDHDDVHSSGSKGRKGAQISSVVPRKGVVEDGTFKKTSNDKNTIPSKNSTYKENSALHNLVHGKKPEFVSDKEDVDDFDKYSIIKTSTTGEDYVIIGIVIVIGIWFSVFGALIFYRRAGEYWDRRHYRRMDFLVEGMYND